MTVGTGGMRSAHFIYGSCFPFRSEKAAFYDIFSPVEWHLSQRQKFPGEGGGGQFCRQRGCIRGTHFSFSPQFLSTQLTLFLRTQLGAPASNTEGEQMRAAGEGDIYKAQSEKTGFGEQGDLVAGMDRKREEHDRIKEERWQQGGEGEVDVEAAVGGRGKGFVGVNS